MTKKLTPEEKRISIAKVSGASIDFYCPEHGTVTRSRVNDGKCPWCGSECNDELPDYFNDLNAMHEAEKALMTRKNAGLLITTYVEILQDSHSRWLTSCFATAAQRAEAFGLTLKLWEAGE